VSVALDHCVIHVSDWARANAFRDPDGSLMEFIAYAG
jgi:hypothetical protein